MPEPASEARNPRQAGRATGVGSREARPGNEAGVVLCAIACVAYGCPVPPIGRDRGVANALVGSDAGDHGGSAIVGSDGGRHVNTARVVAEEWGWS